MTFMPFDDIFLEEARFVSSKEHLPRGGIPRVGSNNHGKGKSNVLFADGHVAMLSTAGLNISEFATTRP